MNLNLSASIRRAAVVLALAIPVGAIAAASPAAVTYPAGAAVNIRMVPDTVAEAANMQTVRDFYAAMLIARDFKQAERYLGPEYIQHAVGLADGKAGVERRIAEISEQFPDIAYDIKHITADGDLVTMMTNIVRTPGTLGLALFHIYRFSNGKIVEHWETWQDVPADSANSNGMF